MRNEDSRTRLLPPAAGHPPPKLGGRQRVQRRCPGDHTSASHHGITVPPRGGGWQKKPGPVDCGPWLCTVDGHRLACPAPFVYSSAALCAIRAVVAARIALKSASWGGASGFVPVLVYTRRRPTDGAGVNEAGGVIGAKRVRREPSCPGSGAADNARIFRIGPCARLVCLACTSGSANARRPSRRVRRAYGRGIRRPPAGLRPGSRDRPAGPGGRPASPGRHRVPPR
jgi:hypothetical protein